MSLRAAKLEPAAPAHGAHHLHGLSCHAWPTPSPKMPNLASTPISANFMDLAGIASPPVFVLTECRSASPSSVPPSQKPLWLPMLIRCIVAGAGAGKSPKIPKRASPRLHPKQPLSLQAHISPAWPLNHEFLACAPNSLQPQPRHLTTNSTRWPPPRPGLVRTPGFTGSGIDVGLMVPQGAKFWSLCRSASRPDGASGKNTWCMHQPSRAFSRNPRPSRA